MRLASGYQYLSVASPSSVMATTMSPLWAVRARRQMTMSPSAIWASIIESPFTLQGELVLPLREPIFEVEPLGLLDGLGEVAGGDLADQRHAAFFLVGVGELDGPRHVRLARDEALSSPAPSRWHITPLGELMRKLSPISRTVGP